MLIWWRGGATIRAEQSRSGGLGVRRKDRQLARGALGAGFRGMDGDIYMEWGVSEVRLWSFCVCGGVVGSTRCSFKWGFSCRNLGSLLVVCVAQK